MSNQAADGKNIFEFRTIVPVEERELAVQEATNVLHDVGNLVNHAGVTMGLLRREWSAPQALQTLRAFIQNAEARPEVLADTIAAGPERLTTYLRAVADRLEADHAAADARLGQVAGTLEQVRDMIRQQQGSARNRDYARLVDVGGVADSVVELLMEIAIERRIDLRRTGPRSLAMVVDRPRLTRVLTNLVSNGLDAVADMPPGRRNVELAVQAAEGGVEFAVRDSGVGIDAGAAKRIFERGFTTKIDGHGFGLDACERAVQEMGGRLGFSSPGPGRGSTFLLFLPWRPAQAR